MKTAKERALEAYPPHDEESENVVALLEEHEANLIEAIAAYFETQNGVFRYVASEIRSGAWRKKGA